MGPGGGQRGAERLGPGHATHGSGPAKRSCKHLASEVGNFSSQVMSGWVGRRILACMACCEAVQMNKNPFGLAPAGPLQIKEVPPNGTAKALLPLTPNQLSSGAGLEGSTEARQVRHPRRLSIWRCLCVVHEYLSYCKVAIKTNVDVFYMNAPRSTCPWLLRAYGIHDGFSMLNSLRRWVTTCRRCLGTRAPCRKTPFRGSGPALQLTRRRL